MKLTLTRVFPPYQGTSKAGKPYTILKIQCQEYGDKQITGFLQPNDPRLAWKAGDQVEWEVKEKGDYLNLADPPKQVSNTQILANGIDKILKNQATIIKMLESMNGGVSYAEDEEIPLDEIPL